MSPMFPTGVASGAAGGPLIGIPSRSAASRTSPAWRVVISSQAFSCWDLNRVRSAIWRPLISAMVSIWSLVHISISPLRKLLPEETRHTPGKWRVTFKGCDRGDADIEFIPRRERDRMRGIVVHRGGVGRGVINDAGQSRGHAIFVNRKRKRGGGSKWSHRAEDSYLSRLQGKLNGVHLIGGRASVLNPRIGGESENLPRGVRVKENSRVRNYHELTRWRGTPRR